MFVASVFFNEPIREQMHLGPFIQGQRSFYLGALSFFFAWRIKETNSSYVPFARRSI